jgi:hypothetical protein
LGYSATEYRGIPAVRRGTARLNGRARARRVLHAGRRRPAPPARPSGADSVTRKNANKSITVSELHRLTGQGRILIVYHHHTRMRGGHINELGHVASRLKELTACRIDALRAKAYSPRAFFLINADGETQVRAADFAQRWVPHVTWHPNLGKL